MSQGAAHRLCGLRRSLPVLLTLGLLLASGLPLFTSPSPGVLVPQLDQRSSTATESRVVSGSVASTVPTRSSAEGKEIAAGTACSPAPCLNDTIHTGTDAVGVASASSADGRVFVSNGCDDNVTVIYDVTNTIVDTIPLGTEGGAPCTQGIGYDRAMGQIFVALVSGGVDWPGSVYVINATSESVIGDLHVGSNPYDVTYDDDSNVMYVTNSGSDNVSVIAGANDTVVGSIPVGQDPQGMAYDHVQGELFVANSGSNDVSVVNTTTDSLVGTIPVGASPSGVAYDERNEKVFVTNSGSDNVTVISTPSGKVVANIGVGAEPVAAVYDNLTGDIYVPNEGSDNVSVVSEATGAVVATVPLTGGPTSENYIPALRSVYVGEPSGVAVLWASGWVVPPPVINGFSAKPASLAAGSWTNLTVNASGGFRFVLYTYTGLPAGCVSANLSTLPCQPAVPGTYSVRVYVNDSLGQSVDRQTKITVGEAVPVISAFTASPNPVGIGGASDLNVTASDWSAVMSYAYAGLPPGCSTDNTSSLVCSPTATGAYTVRVYVNNTASLSADQTAQLDVSTPSMPTIFAFGSAPALIEVGWTSFLNVSAAGGTGSLTYAYAGLPSGCTSSNSSSLACAPGVSGSFALRVYVNDSGSNSATATATLTVDPALSLLLTASTLTIDPGQTALLSAAASGGSTSYPSFAFYAGASCTGTPLQSGPSSTYRTAALAVTTRYCGMVTDSLEGTATNPATVSVNPALVVTLSAGPSTLDPGQTSTLSASASGGSGSYATYAFFSGSSCGGNPLQSGSSDLYTTAPLSTTTTFCVEVTDSLGGSSTGGASVTVDPALTVVVTAAPATVDQGQSSALSAVPSGGSGDYVSFTFYSGTTCQGTPLASGPTDRYTTPALISTARYCVDVTDTLSGSGTGTVTVTVDPVLGLTVSAAPMTVDPGQTSTLSAAATGGSGTYPSYSFYSGSLCSGTPLQSGSVDIYTTSPLSTTSSFCIEVNDSLGGTAGGGVTVTVDPPLMLSVDAFPSTVDPGQTSTLTASATGGSGTFSTYAFFGDAACTGTPIQTGPSSSAASAPLASSTTFCVQLTDSLGGSASATVAVEVNPALAVTVTASPSAIDPGQTSVLTAHASGGTGTYETFTFYLGSSCSGTSLASGTPSSYTTGALDTNTTFCAEASDSLGGTTHGLVTVTVLGTLVAPTIASSTKAIDLGQGSTLTTVTPFHGGVAPFECHWLEEAAGGSSFEDLGSPLACPSDDLPSVSTGTLTVAGAWSFELVVNDSADPSESVVSNVVTLTVTAVSALSWISGTVVPGTAGVWIDGQSVTVTSGSFNVTFTEGGPQVYDVHAWEAGYRQYSKNITLSVGDGVQLSIVLAPVPTSAPRASASPLAAEEVLLLGAVGAGVLLVVAALLLRRRSGGAPTTFSASRGSSDGPSERARRRKRPT